MDRDEAFIGLNFVKNHLQQGGFPVAIGTDEADLLARFDQATGIIEQDLSAKGLANALYLKHVLSRKVSYRFLVLWREERKRGWR